MCTTEHIIILRILYGAYSRISDTEVPVGTTEHFTCAKIPVGTTEQIHYTGVPVGTTDLYLFYRNESTRRYYWTYTYFTDTRVPVGTTRLILILVI